MLQKENLTLALRYLPRFYEDRNESIPLKNLGCTVFTEPGESRSFPRLTLDPGKGVIVEYALYFDYDIQHLYDLEHVWVAADQDGNVTDCWSSFHGMRIRASGVKWFRLDGTHPVLYIQPGKHAVLPDPELFGLHSQAKICCRETAGGGLLVPAMLADRMSTNPQRDQAIRAYIREHLTFDPAWEFVPAEVSREQLITWEELKDRIPGYVQACLRQMGLDDSF